MIMTLGCLQLTEITAFCYQQRNRWYIHDDNAHAAATQDETL